MLFNSYIFIFLFLPVTLGVFFALGRRSNLAIIWLTICSLFFYGWWNPNYLPLLLLSISYNYLVGSRLAKIPSKRLLTLGIAGNLVLLGYFKYTGFVISTIQSISNIDFDFVNIILPLGISFFTFTQIAYLVDAYRGEVKDYRPIHYALFVSYFPHLIAGPILHHKEMMPQFDNSWHYRPKVDYFAVGLSVFFIGLFKKVVFADGIAPYAKMAFDAAGNGLALTFFEAWGGVLAYSMQIYFDFSGYSDMAAGVSLLFGIKLPMNFYSPYQATSIIDFWRRWHITLSRFLRDYLYIALGGNRHGSFLRYRNLLLTMLIGGFWHGAGWNFLIWGALHGFFLVTNHLWRVVSMTITGNYLRTSRSAIITGWLLTFCAVTIAWTFFRANDLNASILMIKAMFGFNGMALPERLYFDLGEFGHWLHKQGVMFKTLNAGDIISLGGVSQIGLLTALAVFAPNSWQLLHQFQPCLENKDIQITPPKLKLLTWQPKLVWAIATAFIALVAVVNITNLSEFLYFQF